ncbi:MAG: D-alanyl-D-alanine carboxypeptidase family protein [Myxococcota bacterium]|nr:D-alanyl-D-alanine carboxypeptidase family protein [Myxococcota bacterium]
MRLLIALLVCLCGVVQADARTTRGYKNGKPVKIRVTTIGWAEVEVLTAKAFRMMERAAEKDGISLTIRSGFRDHDRQKFLYRAYREGWGNKAARPGFSNHESGRALDIHVDGDTLRWLSRNAKRFGFTQTVRGEPWHWEFSGRLPKEKRVARATSKRRRS